MNLPTLMDHGKNLVLRCACLFSVLTLAASPALAHTTNGLRVGFVSGFTHPLTGIDHILAMVAVGIWGTQLRQPAIWLLPVTFPLVMSLGGVMGVRGLPFPGVEVGIAASAVVLGSMILLSARLPIWVAAAIVGTFAVFHGYAHGVELPKAAYPLAYGVGFVLSTGLLHATGIGIALIETWPFGVQALRALGGVISAVGVYLLISMPR